MRRSLLILFGVVSLSAFSIFGERSPRIETAGVDGRVERFALVPAGRLPVIVEFQGIPKALLPAGKRAAGHEETLERFRRDLSEIEAPGTSGRKAASERPRREYTTAFFGAAVSVAPASLDAIRRLPYVRAVHRDAPVKAYSTGTVVDARTGVNAQALPTRGEGIVVAVIDTGIDYTHPALGGGFGPGFKVAGGHDFVNDDDDPMDDDGHGTHVAGTIAADAADLIGVAPSVTLHAYKVLGAGGTGSASDVLAGIERAVDPNGDGDPSDHVDVINMSLGGPGTAEDATSRAVDNAVSAGVVVCVAAGNAGELGSIGSPGAAARAITVGAIDDGGAVTSFSSRGPTPRFLTFKPDVMAPGYEIVSAGVGGGTVAASGTSMATPHVAGVCAVLRKLHPDWSPAEVKAALVSGAVGVNDLPLARGAGRVDAQRANGVSVFPSDSGLIFGLRSDTAGNWQQTKSITVTNRGVVEQTFALSASGAPDGLRITLSPVSIQLAPGASQSVSVSLSGDNAVVAFPESGVVGGDIRFTGSASFSVAWTFVRAARATLHFDGVPSSATARSNSMSRHFMMYEPGAGEIFVPPGKEWDIEVSEYELAEGGRDATAYRRLTVEKRMIGGDETIDLLRSDASVTLVLDGRDEDGVPFSRLPEVDGRRERTVILRFLGNEPGTTASSTVWLGNVQEISLTPVSDRYTVVANEIWTDADALRSYNVQNVPMNGVSESRTFTVQASSLTRARLRFGSSRDATNVEICALQGISRTSAVIFSTGGCVGRPVVEPLALEYFTSDEPANEVFAGVLLAVGNVVTPPFRGRNGSVVASFERVPAVTAFAIRSGGEATIGLAPTFPFASPGTTGGAFVFVPPAGVTGPLGEHFEDSTSSSWTMFDDHGTILVEGTHGGESSTVPPRGQPGWRLLSSRSDLRAAGRPARGILEVRFGSDPADLVVPTFTSLQLLGATGSLTDRLANGESALLRFSAADVDYQQGASTKPARPEATRLFWRTSGAAGWAPLPVVITGSEEGSRSSRGHFPAGDIYSADLSAATAASDSLIDLRIEIEDAAGNRLSWTQQPAFAVGQPPAVPVRSRAIRF